MCATLRAESGWTFQSPYPQGNWLNGVSFTDANTGVAVGDSGTIIATSDGGATWTIRDSGTLLRFSAVEYLDATNVLVVGAEGTVLRSTDAGVSWSPVNSGTSDNLTSLSFVDASTGYALGSGGTLLITTDGGVTWMTRSVGSPSSASMSDVGFADANTGWVVGYDPEGLSDVILRTTDGGSTWTDQSTGSDVNLARIQVFDADHALITEYGRLLRTTDGGSNWTEVVSSVLGTGDGNPDNDVPFDMIEFLDADNGYISGGVNGLFRTSDGGGTWTNQWTRQFPGGDLSYGNAISFIDVNTVTLVGRGGLILRSSDGGSTWTEQSKSAFARYGSLDGVYFTDANTGFVVGGQVGRTVNGGATWEIQSSGLAGCEFLNDIIFTDADHGTAVGVDYCNYRGIILTTANAGQTWTKRIIPNRPLRGVAFLDAMTGTAVGDDGYMLQTTDGGLTWVPRSSGTANTLTSVAFADANTGIAVGWNGTARYTTDGGATWKAGTVGPDMWLFDVTFPSSGVAIAVGRDGDNALILRSTDGGVTWSTQVNGLGGFLSAVSFGDADTGTAVGEVILRTEDAGQTWTSQDNPAGGIADVYFVDVNTGTILGDSGAILRTTTGGESPDTRPQLSVGHSGGDLVLSWPASFTGFDLEWSATVGSSASWSPVSGVPVPVGDHFEYQEPVSDSSSRFYRLSQP